jgi:hypothetical protein
MCKRLALCSQDFPKSAYSFISHNKHPRLSVESRNHSMRAPRSPPPFPAASIAASISRRISMLAQNDGAVVPFTDDLGEGRAPARDWSFPDHAPLKTYWQAVADRLPESVRRARAFTRFSRISTCAATLAA